VAAQWSWLLADLRTGAPTAEIPLSGGRLSQRLNAAGSASGTWTISPRWAGGDPYLLTTPARTMLYALRDGRPMWGGIVWTRRWNPDSHQLELGAVDWWSYFEHRAVLPAYTPDGTTYQVAGLTTTFEQVEQNDIVRALITQAQAHTGGDIGIVADATVSGILRDRTYGGHELVDVATALKNLAEVIDGPDLLFSVAPELDDDGRIVKTLRIGDPKLGQDGDPHVFESGGGIMSYGWSSDGTRMATRYYAVGEGIEAGQLIAVAENGTRYDDGWPVLEAEQNYSTVSTDDTLQEHADSDLIRARLPVVAPALTVRGDGRNSRGIKVGPSIGDYVCGDEIRVVLNDLFFSAGVDTTMRIIGVDYGTGENGVETATLTVNPLTDDVA
jgi:hypothetical protein